jgi:hypothetical protein
MPRLESNVHWRPWSIAVVLLLFIALFSMTQFNLIELSTSIYAGCGVLFLSAGWNVYVILLARSGNNLGWNAPLADGLLMAGLILIFIGAFF